MAPGRPEKPVEKRAQPQARRDAEISVEIISDGRRRARPDGPRLRESPWGKLAPLEETSTASYARMSTRRTRYKGRGS